MLRPALSLALLAGLAVAPPARAAPLVCSVMLLDARAESGRDAVQEARRALELEGCQPGDAVMIVGSGHAPERVAAGVCRAGAMRRIEALEGPDEAYQVHCEYPLPAGPLRARR